MSKKEPRFKVGQVVMYDRPGKLSLPMVILEIIEQDGEFFNRFDRRNSVHESMLRPLTAEERGDE